MHDDARDKSGQAGDGDASDVPALALGALDPVDEDAALAELHASTSARDELQALEEIVGDLGLAAPQVQPPPALRDRILDAAQTPAAPVPIEAAPSRQRSLTLWAGSLAAALLVVLLSVAAFTQWSIARDRADRIDELEAQLAVQDERLAELERAAASAGAFVDFEQPLIWTELTSTSASSGSRGFLARTPDGEAAYLLLTGVEVDPGRVFQAWLIEDAPVSVGTFRPDDNGLGFLILQHRGEPVQGFDLIGISVEPPGGSPQPTTDPIIIAEIV